MKKRNHLLLMLLIFILCSSPLFASQIVTRTLPNGMQVALRQTNDRSVALYIFVKTGSIHEGELLGHGVSHYLEHLIAGGSSEFRTETEYQEIAASIGASTNAFTTYDMTAIHTTVEPEYLYIALQMLAEQVMHCRFDEDEVEREKQVIMQEILMSSTPPMAQREQRMMEVTNPNTHYRYPIIGFVEYFQHLTREDLIYYYLKRYTPHNMIVVAVGGFTDTDALLDQIATTFEGFYRPPSPEIVQPVNTPPIMTYTIVEEFDLETALVSMYRPYKIEDDMAVRMALELLFDRRDSPIGHYLLEETQLVNQIYTYGHSDGLNLGFEPRDVADIERILEIIDEKLLEYAKPRKITQKMIDDQIRSFEASMYLVYNSPDNEATSIGYSMIEFNMPDYYDRVIDLMRQVTVDDVQRVIKEHLLGTKVIFYALPRGTKSLLSVETQLVVSKSDIQRHTVNDRTTLIYKYSNEKPIVRVCINIPTSTLYETETNAGIISFMGSVMFKGSKKYPSIALSSWLEDRAIRIYSNANTNGLTIAFSCLVADLDDLTVRLVDAIANPLFDDDEIELYKTRLFSRAMRFSTYPSRIHSEFTQKISQVNPRDQLSRTERLLYLNEIKKPDLVSAHRKYFTAEKVNISILGDIDENRARQWATHISSKIPNKAIDEVKTPREIAIHNATFVNTYAHEQVNISINMHAPIITAHHDFITMLAIEKILSGGSLRGRLYNATRRDNDLAYFAFADYTYASDIGLFSLSTQTSLDRKDELIAVLLEEIDKLKTEPVTEREIYDAIIDYAKTFKNDSDDDDLVRLALTNEITGLGYDFIDTQVNEMLKVTPQDIEHIANKYFDKWDVIISEPDKEYSE